MKARCPDVRTPEPDLATVEKSMRAADYADFLKYVAQATGAISYGELAILYPAICQAAMEWVLVKHKPMDLGFVTLYPRPHRANWRAIMIALFPTLGPAILGKSRKEREALLTSTGFEAKLLSGELLAVGLEKVVTWGIEAEPRRSWWTAMFRQEKSKLFSLGSVGYAAHTAKEIIRLKPSLYRAYISYLRQVAYPCAKIQHSRVYGRGFIVPLVNTGRVRPVVVDNVPVSPVVPRDPQDVVAPKVADLAPTDAGLPSVSDIQPGPFDLRVSGGADAKIPGGP